ncbi:hypothetical protein C6988_07770 [Nitrosopumilus sp. b1]|nr:hypothetical protein C6988_07770 [Nitrosopumilus sp. b1]
MLNQTQTNRTLANVCLFCNQVLNPPTMCRYCGFKFCDEHLSSESHQCIKTRYSEYIKKTDNPPNVINGKFRVVCNVCGFVSKKPTPIEYAGEELIQHTQMIGCSQNIYLEEINPELNDAEKIRIKSNTESESIKAKSVSSPTDMSSNDSVVEQILRLSTFKEKGMISDEEFNFIKKELIKRLK